MTSYYLNEGTSIDHDLQIFSYNKQRELALNYVINSKECLVLRISRQDCSSCIDSVYSIVKEVFNGRDIGGFIVLSDEPNPRKAIVYQRIQGVKYPIYQINKDKLPVSFDSQTPYFFIINDNYEIRLLHKVNVNYLQLTRHYLEIVVERFLESG